MKDGILIIEDNEVQSKLVRKMLESFVSYDIYEARDGDQAMDQLAIHRIQVVLCDIGLPGISGLDLARSILKKYKHILLIMLTANEDLKTSEQAIDLGAYGYLVKPVMASQLRISIAQALKMREYQDLILAQQEKLEAKVLYLEKTRKELGESEEKFKTLFDNIQEGFFRVSLDGHLTMANPVVADIMGYGSVEDMKGMAMTDLYRYPPDRQKMLDTLFAEGSLTAYEIEIKKKDDSFGHVLVNSYLRYDDNGSVLGIEGTLVDITHRKRLENDLSQAQKLESIGHLAAGIAHEINTPIQYVGDNTVFLQDAFEDLMGVTKGCLRLAAAAQENRMNQALVDEVEKLIDGADLEFLEEEVPASIGQSLDGIARVSKIVKSMKAFSHPGGDIHELADINAALEHTITVARSEWKYVAELTMDLHKDLPWVSCNLGEMNQVFLNLLINASHAVEDALIGSGDGKGEIQIQTRDRDGDIEIRIMDTGKGILESVRDQVFDPFFTTKKIGKGSGQGLAIARSIVVDKHGGKIWFETGEEKGTCFFIRIPK